MKTLKQQLQQKYDHVKTLTETSPDIAAGDTIALRRHPETGQTTEITVKATAQQNQELIIAGNTVKWQNQHSTATAMTP